MKTLVLPKEIYGFPAVPVKPQQSFVCLFVCVVEFCKMILKCIWKSQHPRTSRTLLKKTGERDLAYQMPKCILKL